ncbi:hypothetical protein ppKF707_2208 [Metapseudomonas furukawaii]|uniref:Uncharacterized protein n=1 Tax=Metapseudomonas furukawaii TaxID=1149133 RepID=A0AAD1FH33_METFU|nr:hypothetical protein ppKF707_2208 [Pseudomonas furukawaii]BAU75822.1 hypothetical protein KF707C_41340 [Pseudomonas furukawaii]
MAPSTSGESWDPLEGAGRSPVYPLSWRSRAGFFDPDRSGTNRLKAR